MSSAHGNFFSEKNQKPNAEPYKFGIVVASWHHQVTEALFNGAYQTLLDGGAKTENIFKCTVPGSFELTTAAAYLANLKRYDAIICLGCVIQGETRHFEFICNAVANGLTTISIQHQLPVIFGVLTTDTLEQAMERAGGKMGHKGVDAALTAIQMAELKAGLK